MGKSLFKPEYVEVARRLCEKGATDSEIAAFFGVTVKTYYGWRHRHPGFLEAIKAGKDYADERVERRLYEKALEGDNTAMIFWLKNRRPEQWRDRVDHTITKRQESAIDLLEADVIEHEALPAPKLEQAFKEIEGVKLNERSGNQPVAGLNERSTNNEPEN